MPPPLPAKTRDSNDYSNLPPAAVTHIEACSENYSIVVVNRSQRPLPAEPNGVTNASYEFVEAKQVNVIEDKRRPPTPPPKPSRNSRMIPS